MSRAVAAAAAVAVAVLALAACGGDDGPEALAPEDFEAGLIAREQFTPETAACISGYLLGSFPDDQMRALAADPPTEVPPQVWGRYTQVVLACQYHDQLGVPDPAGAP